VLVAEGTRVPAAESAAAGGRGRWIRRRKLVLRAQGAERINAISGRKGRRCFMAFY
jgi:hypothetical protein